MNKKIIGIFVMTLMIASIFTTPLVLADGIDQYQTHDSGVEMWIRDDLWGAQSFKPTLSILTKVELKCSEWGTADYDIIISIRSSKNGNDLTSLSVSPGELPTPGWYEFNFPDIQVTPESPYFIVLRTNDPDNHYSWCITDQNQYTRGEGWVWDGSSWETLYSKYGFYDFCFKTYGYDNSPPNTPNNPDPYDGETGVGINHDLSWDCSDPDGDDLTYDVYFGTSSNPPKVSSGQSSKSYNPGTMSYSTKYYWKIVAKDEYGPTTTGPIWDFTTVSPPEYSITFYTNPTSGGTITFNGVSYSNGQSTQVVEGTYSVTANPATNYVFDHWTSTCGSIANPNSQTTTITVNSNGNLKAYFNPESGGSDWTLMVYLDGDNNLEKFGVNDFLEMAEVGSTNDVNIIVQFDRVDYPIPEYDDTRYDDWTTTKRYRVTQGMVPNIANAIMDIGEANMGDPQTLIDFVDWATTNFPADQYCLILWDHGSGWKHASWEYKSICEDHTSGDALEMDELRNALSSVTNNGNEPIDLIGFDACLMQMIEVGYEIADYCEYMTGSEEVEPAFGWNYDDTLTILTGTPTMSPQTLGAQFVSDYINENGLTLSTINLGLINDLRNDVSNLGTSLQNDGFRDEISNAIDNVEKYWISDYVDLYHFAQLIRDYIDDSSVDANAQAVIAEIDNVVTSENHNSDYVNSHGISIYVPNVDYDQSYADLLFAEDSQWDEFLYWYHKGSGENNPPNAPIINGPKSGKTGETYTYTFVAIDPEGDDLYYYIDWGDGNTEEWIGPFGSDEVITKSHSWNKGEFKIRARAKDTDGATGNWAEYTVTMPRNRAVNRPFLNFLNSHPNMFPILRLLLQRLGL